MVLQHGKTPTNKDLNGNPLKPVLTAIKQGGAATTRPEPHETHSASRRGRKGQSATMSPT